MKKYRFETNNYQSLAWIIMSILMGTVIAHLYGDGFDWQRLVLGIIIGSIPGWFVFSFGKRIED